MSQVEYDVDQGEEEDKDKDKETQYVAVETDLDEHEDKDADDVDGNVDADEAEEDDTRAAGNRDEDDEDKKKSRRDENKSRRVRQREARERTERELTFLRDRNESLERRFSSLETEMDARVTGSEMASVDQQISKSKSDLQLANQVIAQAADNNDGANLAEALNHRDAIRDTLKDLEQAKEYIGQERETPTQKELDPRHVAHAQAFMREHDWWDPRGGDPDSQAVLVIDRSLVQEGYQPATKEYWDELKTRVQKAVPSRYESGDDEGEKDTDTGRPRKQRRQNDSGPEFRTGGRERPLKKNEVYISAERREAMEEAGVWEDPVLRNKFLKSYATYDAQAAEERS